MVATKLAIARDFFHENHRAPAQIVYYFIVIRFMIAAKKLSLIRAARVAAVFPHCNSLSLCAQYCLS
jgi:hypothetical protein